MEIFPLPPLDLGLVALAGTQFGALAGPAKTVLQNVADMLDMIADAELVLDHGGHPCGGPEIVGPTVDLGPLLQERDQLALLFGGHLARPPGMRLGRQAAAAISAHLYPAPDAVLGYPQDTRHRHLCLAVVYGRVRLPAAALQFCCRSLRSHDRGIGSWLGRL